MADIDDDARNAQQGEERTSDVEQTLKWTISPVPEKWATNDLKKALKIVGVDYARITKVFGQTFGKIAFRSFDQLAAAKSAWTKTIDNNVASSSIDSTSSSSTDSSSSTIDSSSSTIDSTSSSSTDSSSSSTDSTSSSSTDLTSIDSTVAQSSVRHESERRVESVRGCLPGCATRVFLQQHTSQKGRLRTQRKRDREESFAVFARSLRQRVAADKQQSAATDDAPAEKEAGDEEEAAAWQVETAWASELDELEKRILSQTMPLWKLAYDEQIAWKTAEMRKVLQGAVRQVRDSTRYAPQDWMRPLKSGSTICPFLGVVPCPEEHRWHYRSKSDFTVGRRASSSEEEGRPEGGEVMVGFPTGDMASGHSSVGPPYNVRITSEAALRVCRVFQQYLTEHSSLPPFDKTDKSGFWRSLVVRSSQRTGDVMVFVQVAEDNVAAILQQRGNDNNNNNSEAAKEVVAQEKRRVADYLVANVAGVVSVLWLNWSGIANAVDTTLPVETLHGQSYYTERLFELVFRVSAHSFFQNNVAMAELLFRTVQEWIAAAANTVLFDVCCGTGVIGLSMAARVTHVVGVDISEQAVADAKLNAELNGLTNCTFEAGKAEDVLPRQIASWQGGADDMCAIVDPARTGLHPSVVSALRRCQKIKRLVYVSCNPNALVKDMKDLCRGSSKTMPGPPFQPVQAQAFDMFPYTEHVELVVLFTRE